MRQNLYLVFGVWVMTASTFGAPLDVWKDVLSFEVPAFEWVVESDETEVRGLYLEGPEFKNRSTRAFAYYGAPMQPSGSTSRKTFPGIVLVHGGGGRAFKEWVEMWVKRGYAAIAVDTGGLDNPDGFTGPKPWGDVTQLDQPLKEQWPYHAVARIVLAHSLIRSFPEVDESRVAITGISWGGVLTCMVSGIDHRFVAAVPVYGGGYLYVGDGYFTQRLLMMPESFQSVWMKNWDPSLYIPLARIPMLFINGTEDPNFPLPQYARSTELAEDGCFRILPLMRHGKKPGWDPIAIELFINSHCRGGVPLPELINPLDKSGMVSVQVVASTQLRQAKFCYSTQSPPYWNERGAEFRTLFSSFPVSVSKDQILSVELPEDTRCWFFTCTDERGARVSSRVVFE